MRILRYVLFSLCISTSVIADDVAVTVYNSNIGVVSENRELHFKKGTNEIAIQDVPALIDPASVRFEFAGKSKIAILEQNYAYDLVSSEQMYLKYIDKEIELTGKDGSIFKGVLLSSDRSAITIQEESGRIKIIQLSQVTEVSFPVLPDGLITKPTLFWKYSSEFEGTEKGNISYQTTGMNWAAEYVGLLNEDDTKLSLNGWASINNQSGKTYTDAKLKLIAGDIHRAETDHRLRRGMAKTMALADAESAGFEEKSFFEYHMYTLPRKATLANKENKQISLFEPAIADVKKVFIYRPDRNQEKIEVALKFVNSSKTGLGMPLPAGRVRLFKADSDGSKVLLGEDRIEHTPKDEKVTVQVGNAFDITAEYKMLSQNRVSSKVEEQKYEITLNNRKDSPVSVEIEKKLYGFWEIVQADFEYEKKDAQTIICNQKIEKSGSITITFTVRYTHR